jgi:hypothetical protein
MHPRILWPLIAALVIGLAFILYPRKAPEPVVPVELPAPPQAAPAERSSLAPRAPEPEPVFITEEAAEPLPPLPALADSDAEAREALGTAAGATLVERHLVPDGLIRKLVATVDNLTGGAIWMKTRVVQAQEGLFLIEGDEDALVIAAANARRYQPLVQLVAQVDVAALAAAYQRYYPLLQEAYAELGYPERQFHNRALEVIDHLLATPVVEGPIRLEQPHVLYTFADPRLEALSSGQKILVRVGPENAAVLRGKLAELRAALAGLAETPRAD